MSGDWEDEADGETPANGSALAAPLVEARDTSHVLVRDKYDGIVYGGAREDVPELAKLEGGKLGRALVEDAFSSLVRYRPEADPETTAPAKHRAAIEEMLGTQEYAALRERTKGDEAASALATVELCAELAKRLPADRKPERKPGQAPQGTPAPGGKPGKPVAGDGEPTEAERDEARAAARAACMVAAEAVDEAEAAEAALYGIGAGGESQARHTDRNAMIEMRRKLAGSKRGRGTLAAVMQMAGRMRRVMETVRATRARRGPGAIIGTELGANPATMLPVELVATAPGAPEGLRLDFLRRFAEREVLQLRTQAEEKVGRGPIVVCLDESGSMAGAKEIWSKAIVLTLLQLAAEEGRAFAFIPFAGAQDRTPFLVHRWAKRPSPEEIIGALDGFINGGTDFAGPLDAAMKEIEAAGELKHADVIFVTDGIAQLEAGWLATFKARKEARAAKLYPILLDVARGTPTPLDTLADDAVRVTDIRADGEALEMAFSVGLQ